MPIMRNTLDHARFNPQAKLPYELRIEDFRLAAQDVYDFYDVNTGLTLTVNAYFNVHPDLVVRGQYANNAVKAGDQGVEIKTTRKAGGAVDTHGARNQWMGVFVYQTDAQTEPAIDRRAMTFTQIYLGPVTVEDFRRNERGELGTRTATLDARGIAKLRSNRIYLA